MPSFTIQLRPVQTPFLRVRHHYKQLHIPRISPDDQIYTIEVATLAASTASALTALWFHRQSHPNTSLNQSSSNSDINSSNNEDDDDDFYSTTTTTTYASPLSSQSPWDAAWQALNTATTSTPSQDMPSPLTTPLFMIQAIKLSHRIRLITLCLKSLQQHIETINNSSTSSSSPPPLEHIESIIATCARTVVSQFTPYDSHTTMHVLNTSILNDTSMWWPPLKERITPYSDAVHVCCGSSNNSNGGGDSLSTSATTTLQPEYCFLVLVDMSITIAELVAAAIVTQSLPLSSSSSSSMVGVKDDNNSNGQTSSSSSNRGMQTSSLRMIKRQLSNTRALQRFVNQVTLCRWMETTFFSVVNIVEDRLVLYRVSSTEKKKRRRSSSNDDDETVVDHSNSNNNKNNSTSSTSGEQQTGSGLLSTIAIPMKRTQELRNLSGLRFAVSLFLEASDLLSPLLNTFWRSALAGAAWLLVQFVGRALGLVWKGIKLSFDSGIDIDNKDSSSKEKDESTKKKKKKNRRKGQGDGGNGASYQEEEGSPSVWGGGGMWSPVY